MAELGQPKNTIDIIKKYDFRFRKKFGQNFLIDTHVLDKIARSAEIGPEDCVLEIGPGIGTLTQVLAEHAGQVVAVEIDPELIPILKETLADYPNATVIHNDILKTDIRELAESLEFPELMFLQDAWLDLERRCNDTEFMEDLVAAGHPDDPSWLPDPGWKSLRLRLYELAMYGLGLGIDLSGAEHALDFDGWSDRHQAFGEYVTRTNGDWQKWYERFAFKH